MAAAAVDLGCVMCDATEKDPCCPCNRGLDYPCPPRPRGATAAHAWVLLRIADDGDAPAVGAHRLAFGHGVGGVIVALAGRPLQQHAAA